MKKIGIFDSGVGGRKVEIALKSSFTSIETILLTDKDNLPYGSKTRYELYQLIEPFIKQFELAKVDLILIACNTITTNIIDQIRQLTPLPIVGFEPAIKQAALLSKTRSITVCATKGTLSSTRYAWLVNTYGRDLKIYQPDCTNWAHLIESSSLSDQELKTIVDQSLDRNSDIILLGCTHYHWIEYRLNELAAGRINVIQPTEAVFRQIQQLLQI
ncbi:aspartate/glutamate racemase family protein [Candidatus Saccharibacteria bacterium]|nr:aspartate/glutamate racemase family protein [Candidatus Saccharibacteria bacterium]